VDWTHLAQIRLQRRILVNMIMNLRDRHISWRAEWLVSSLGSAPLRRVIADVVESSVGWQEKRNGCVTFRSCLRTCNHNLICSRWKPLIEDCTRKLPQLNQLAAESVCCAGTGAIHPLRLLCFASPNRIFWFEYFSSVGVLETAVYTITAHNWSDWTVPVSPNFEYTNIYSTSVIVFMKTLWYS
jgi:hypothetical protein